MQKEDFNRISEVMDWYQRLPPGHLELTALMAARRELSVLNVRLAEYVGHLARNANAAEATRKIRFNAVREREVAAGASVSAATSKAEDEVASFRQAEASASGRYASGRILYDAISNVLNSMAGEINFMMRERSLSNHMEN